LKLDWEGISLMYPSRQGPVAGCFEYGNEPSGFNRMRRMSWIAKKLLVSQERLCSMELIWWQFALWDNSFKVCLSSVARQGVWRFELLLFTPWGTTLPQFCCKARCLAFWTTSVYTLWDNSASVLLQGTVSGVLNYFCLHPEGQLSFYLPPHYVVSQAVPHEQYIAVYRLWTDLHIFLLTFHDARKSTLYCPLSRSDHISLPMVYFSINTLNFYKKS
jgi:hypothetical protein